MNLSEKETAQLIELLKKLEPGFLPFDIFLQIARLVALPIIEFVPLRLNESGIVEVLLLPRGDDDPIWPGMLHTPGTVIRATDNEGKIYLAFERILKDELDGTLTSKPFYIGSHMRKSRRGTEQAQIFWVEVKGEPKVGTFYGVNSLPQNLVEGQAAFIGEAEKSFLEYKKQSK